MNATNSSDNPAYSEVHMALTLRDNISLEDLLSYATRHPGANGKEAPVKARKDIENSGFMTKEQLHTLAKWKSPRRAKLVCRNSDDYVKEITKFALNCCSERARIESLTLLDGVGWPIASVILHFYHREKYPLLDFRALWSVGLDVPPNSYNYNLWEEYTGFCRKLYDQAKVTMPTVTMRCIDQALWQYSKEKQP